MLKKRDSEIEQWVLRELRLSKQICSSEVCVCSCDGMVSLSGSAESDYDKLAIEEATLGATGVIGVLNEMKVKLCTAPIQKQPLSLEPPTPGVFLHDPAAQQPIVNPYLIAAVATSKY